MSSRTQVRHLYDRFQQRFGSAGVVIGAIALVVALAGTAVAAGGLTAQQEKQVKKIAKKYAGKPGAPGAQGPAGANGANGKDGAAGPKGATGAAGAPGTAGAKGATGPSGATGATGATGLSGFTETLPSGKTETGAWFVEGEGNTFMHTVISFPIPLAQQLEETVELEESVVKVPTTGFVDATQEAKCENTSHPGTASPANPEATPGHLCIYATFGTISSTVPAKPGGGVAGTSKTGAIFAAVTNAGPAPQQAYGTWAVTAP